MTLALYLPDNPPQPTPYRVGQVRCSLLWPEMFRPPVKGYDDDGTAVVDGSKPWEVVLDRPCTIAFDDLSITLPKGEVIDGASIRYRWVNGVIPRWGIPESMGAWPHDGLYATIRHLIPVEDDKKREWADDVLYRFWRAAGVSRRRAWLGYRAVRMFGGSYWDRGTELGFNDPGTTKASLVTDGRDGAWLEHRRAA